MPLTAVLIALVSPAMAVLGCGSNVSNWLGPPASQMRISDWAGWRVRSACSARSWPSGVSQLMPASPASFRKARRNRAGPAVEFIFAHVAVPFDELVLAQGLENAEQNVGVAIQGLERGGLVQGPRDLLGPQSCERKGGPLFLVSLGKLVLGGA